MKVWLVLLGLAGALGTQSARADDPSTDTPPVLSPKRVLPSYDGRPPPSIDSSEYFLWIPRLVLAPAYVVTEFALRRPLSVAVPAAEKIDLFTKVYDFFVFGKDHKAGIVPTVYAELDFKPSVGVYAFWDDAGFKGHDLSLHAAAWPSDWLAVSAMERFKYGDNRTLQLQVSEVHRPDKLFYGIGPNSLASHESRYGLQRVDGSVAYEWRFWRSSRIETMVGVRDVSTFHGHFAGAPSVETAAANGDFPIPYGFRHRYTDQYNRVIGALDTRVSEPRRGSGIRLELDAEQGSDIRNVPLSGWVRYGATAAGYLDLTGYRRVLSLSVMTQFADSLGSEPVPFPELVYLGGDHAMRGLFWGRLVGQSAAVATASYNWPIGPWVDGDLQLAVGNVFGNHLAGFEPGLLRFSAAVGFSVGSFQTKEVMGTQDAPVEILVGIGSRTFDQGGRIDSVRVMLGVPHAF